MDPQCQHLFFAGKICLKIIWIAIFDGRVSTDTHLAKTCLRRFLCAWVENYQRDFAKTYIFNEYFGHRFRGMSLVWRWDKAGTSCFWDTQFMASLPKLLSTQVRTIIFVCKGFPSKSPKGLTVAKIIITTKSQQKCGLFTFAFATGGAIYISNHNRGRALELLAQLVPILKKHP